MGGSTKPFYDAEFEVRFILENGGTIDFFGSTLVVPIERKFGDIESVQRYVEQVCEYVEFDNPPAVLPRSNDAHAHYDTWKHEIHVPPHRGSRDSWAMREIVVLHELAHAMTPGHDHDSEFCSVFVKLVGKCIGMEAGLLLSAAFGDRGIPVYNR